MKTKEDRRLTSITIDEVSAITDLFNDDKRHFMNILKHGQLYKDYIDVCACMLLSHEKDGVYDYENPLKVSEDTTDAEMAAFKDAVSMYDFYHDKIFPGKEIYYERNFCNYLPACVRDRDYDALETFLENEYER